MMRVVGVETFAVRTAVHEFADYLVGQDPLRIEDHWQMLTNGGFYRGGPILSSAVAGIDQALWDIAGQVYGAPVHAVLGGHVRDRVRMYTWVGGDEPAHVADAIAEKVEQGLQPVTVTLPAVGRIAPASTRNSVVLPASSAASRASTSSVAMRSNVQICA